LGPWSDPGAFFFPQPFNPYTMITTKSLAIAVAKKIARPIAFIAFLAALYAGLTSSRLQSEKSHAAVNQVEGLYIFVESKPIAPTDYLGTVKAGVTWSGDFKEVIAKLVKKAKKEYPAAEGIIFNGDEKADVIKFK
jgi:hypothetical protein